MKQTDKLYKFDGNNLSIDNFVVMKLIRDIQESCLDETFDSRKSFYKQILLPITKQHGYRFRFNKIEEKDFEGKPYLNYKITTNDCDYELGLLSRIW